MRIAVLSDIHDNVWNLRAALHWLVNLPAEERVHELICCGDLCSPFVMAMLADAGKRMAAPVHVVFGNNDGDTSRITAQAKNWDGLHIYMEFAELAVVGDQLKPKLSFKDEQGKNTYDTATAPRERVAINHYDAIARPVAESGRYGLVCFGHNHQRELTRYGEALALNPGTLMGYSPLAQGEVKDVPATFAVYDAGAHDARFFVVEEPWKSPSQVGKVCEG